MLRNLIVCGFALVALVLLVNDANARGRRGGCSSSCSSSSCYTPTTCYSYQQPVHHYAPPAPAPCYTHQQPAYTHQQPVYYPSSGCGTMSCGSSGYGYSSCGSGGCGGRKRCR
jgi:hypothetical protein